MPLPRDGILLTDMLANYLQVGVGDYLDVEIREGERRMLRLPVRGLPDETFGLQAYVHLETLHALLGEVDEVSSILLRIDPFASESIRRRIQNMPGVARMTRPDDAVRLPHPIVELV